MGGIKCFIHFPGILVESEHNYATRIRTCLLPCHSPGLYPLRHWNSSKQTSLANYGSVGRVFANGPGDQGSIPGQVIPKTFKKWYLIPPCLTLSIIRYVSRVKGSIPRKGVASSPTPRCSSYWKGSLRVALDSSCQQRQYHFSQFSSPRVSCPSGLMQDLLNTSIKCRAPCRRVTALYHRTTITN